MKTIETLNQLIAENQAMKINRTPSLDAALRNLLHAREAMQDHLKCLERSAASATEELDQKEAELAALKTTVAETAAS